MSPSSAHFRLSGVTTSFKAIVFDLDGTLVDSAAGIEECLRQLSKELGRGDVTAARVRHLVSRGVVELVSQSVSSPDPETAQADVVAFRKIYAERRTHPRELFDGVQEGLAALRESGLPLGICTNKPHYLAERVLGDTGLAPYISVLVGGDVATVAKPDGAHVADVARGLGTPLADCILVGDSEVDEAAARNAGIPFLLMSYGYALGSEMRPQARFDRFPDLVETILTSLTTHE